MKDYSITEPEHPRVSVIIPTYGRIEYVLDCVGSILTGSYTNFEILVVDQDESQLLRSKLGERFGGDSRLRYCYAERAGAAAARNAGIQQARGEIVAFIDDDALADPGWLAAIVKAFETIHPSPGIVNGRIEPVWPNGGQPDWLPAELRFVYGHYDIGDKLCPMPEPNLPLSGNSAGLREVILGVGGFDTALGRNYFRKLPKLGGEDSLLGMRLKQAGYELYYQPEAVVQHRLTPSKVTKRVFLDWHFWEGVTKVVMAQRLGQLQLASRVHMICAHGWRMAKAVALFIVPGFLGRHKPPHQVTRMLALSKLAYSLGVMYGAFAVPGGSPEGTA